MKICTVAPGFNRHGGVPYVARNVVRQMALKGAECWVVTDQDSSGDMDSDVLDSIPIYTRRRSKRLFPLNILQYARRIAPVIETLDERHDLDFIHTHGNYVLGPIVADLLGGVDTPVVTTIHDTHLPEIRSFSEYPPFKHRWKYCSGIYIDYRIQQFGAKRVDRIHAVGSRVVSELTERGIDRDDIGLVHNGIDLEEFDESPSKEDVRETYGLEGAELVISVGSLRPRKGVHTLVEAAEHVRRENPAAHIAHIGGHGRTGYVDHVKRRIQELGVDDTVSIIGPVDRRELLGWYDTSDALVSASYSEGNPINVLEAAASECNIVTTEVWDAREILGDDAVFITPGSPPSVASGILEGLTVDNGASLRERVEANYTWDAVGEEYQRMFEKWSGADP